MQAFGLHIFFCYFSIEIKLLNINIFFLGATLWVRLSAVSFLAKKPEKDAAAILRAVTVEIYEMGFLIYDLRSTIYEVPFTKYHLRSTIYEVPFTKYDLRSGTYECHWGQSLASEIGKLVSSNKKLINVI